VQLGLPRREIPVKAVFVPEGLQPVSVFLEPPSVELQGPRDLLDAQEYIRTEVIDLKALGTGEEQHTFTVPLFIPEGLEAVDHSSVRIRFNLGG
jgi:YbbR domain-containing protein